VYWLSGDIAAGWCDDRTHFFTIHNNDNMTTNRVEGVVSPTSTIHGFGKLEIFTYVFSQTFGMTIRHNGRIIVNNALYTSAVSIIGSNNPLCIGGSGFGGHIAEIMMYPRALSTSILNENENYLIGRWGVSIL